MNKNVSIVIVVLVVIAGVYWLSTMGPVNSGNTDTTTETQDVNGIKVTNKGPVGIATGPSGEYLVDRDGLTLYFNINDQDPSGEISPSCNTQCEGTWLPFLLGDEEAGISESNDELLSKLNLFQRADGSQQYALGNLPLYRNVNDTKLGDINKGVESDWAVAKP